MCVAPSGEFVVNQVLDSSHRLMPYRRSLGAGWAVPVVERSELIETVMNRNAVNLISQEQVRQESRGWHRIVFDDIESRLSTDPDFPCVFSRNAFRKQLLKFTFVEQADAAGIRHLGDALAQYVEISRHWDGSIDTAYPLVAAFSLLALDSPAIEEHHAFGWRVLQQLHEIDPSPWPQEVGNDPEADSWSMCFAGMPLFCNMSSPTHRVRRSRNLGTHFALVINPRERFDVFAGDTPGGRKVRSNIRNRIGRYDRTPHALQLSTYGAGGAEWWQYSLAEENIERHDSCPFLFRKATD